MARWPDVVQILLENRAGSSRICTETVHCELARFESRHKQKESISTSRQNSRLGDRISKGVAKVKEAKVKSGRITRFTNQQNNCSQQQVNSIKLH